MFLQIILDISHFFKTQFDLPFVNFCLSCSNNTSLLVRAAQLEDLTQYIITLIFASRREKDSFFIYKSYFRYNKLTIEIAIILQNHNESMNIIFAP